MYWGRPEDASPARLTRPVYTVDVSKPGADVVAQTAAALAAVAATIGELEDPGLVARLMRHARWLFAFAKQVRPQATLHSLACHMGMLEGGTGAVMCCQGDASAVLHACEPQASSARRSLS